MTNKQFNTINTINAATNNASTVTRAQILDLVNAGAFKWPYWITDHKHGYAVSNGVYTVPTATEPTVKAPKVTKAPTKLVFRVGKTVIPGKFKTPEAALEVFVANAKKAKRAYKFATVEMVVPALVTA